MSSRLPTSRSQPRPAGRRTLAARLASAARAALAVTGLVALAACGGGGSGFGEAGAGKLPIAVASVINTGAGPSRDAKVKSGTDVLLSGKDSDGTDSPVLRFVWSQTDTTGPRVEFVERNNNTVVFTAPQVAVNTDLHFRLTVTDAEGDVATDDVTVTVVPVGDVNRFLTYINSPSDSYIVVATLDRGTRTTAPVNFRITQRTGVSYTDRTGTSTTPNRTLILDDVPLSVSSAFTAGTNANWNSIQESVDAFYAPRYVLRIPDFDADLVNKRFQTANRDARLEPQFTDDARFFVDLALTVDDGTCLNEIGQAVNCQDRVVLYVMRRDGTRLPLQAGRTSYRIGVEELAPTQATQPGQTGPDTQTTAKAYYRAVDPFNRRMTLSAWLELAGFTRNGVPVPETEYTHATYVNNFDLGFGRDMFMRRDPATGIVYSYVSNYPTLEAALKRLNNFAAVVMEYSPPDQDPSGQKFVKFFAYVPDDSGDLVRAASFNFDGRGEKWIPGACTVCHGGRPTFLASGEYANFGNVNAGFLPFDVNSYLLTRGNDARQTDPDLNPREFTEADLARYSRSGQEAEFKQLNMMVASTYQDPVRFGAAIELVHGMYGDTTPPYDSFPRDTFDDNFVAAGWRGQETLYREVFGPYCRACHVNNDRDTFADVDDLIRVRDRVKEVAYEEGTMPLARLTHDRFWIPFEGGTSAAEKLRTALAAFGTPAAGATPGLPVARISGNPTIAMNQDQIRLDGSTSPNASTYRWRFLARPVLSNAVLVGNTTNAPAFMADQPGEYRVELVVGNLRGESVPAVVTIRADSASPFQVVPTPGVRPSVGVSEGGVAPITPAVLRYEDIDNSPAEITYRVVTPPTTGMFVQTETLSTVTFTQADIDAGRVEYRHNGAENTSDEAVLSVSDGTSTITGQGITFIVVPANDSPTLVRNLPLSVPENGSVTIGMGSLAVADNDNTASQLLFVVTAAPLNGSLNRLSFTQADIDNGSLVYTHAGGENAADTFTFTVSDGGTALGPLSFAFDILAVADSPTAVNTGPLTAAIRGRTTAITASDLRFDDSDSAANEVVYTVVSAPSGGVLTNGTVTLTRFTQQDINDGNVLYRNTGDRDDLGAATADAFTYRVSDGTTTSATRSFAITVNPAPDAPMRGVSDLMLQAFGVSGASTITNQELAYSTSSGAVPVYVIVTPPANGTLLVNGAAAASFTQTDVNLGRVTYTPGGLSVTDDEFTFRVQATVAPGVTLTVPSVSRPPETLTIGVFTSFARDIAGIFRTRYDNTRRACMECHCPSGSPGCTIAPDVAEPISPSLMPDWAANPAVAAGLLRQVLQNVDPVTPENSLVLQRPQGIGHSGGERPGFDLDGNFMLGTGVTGDRTRHDLLLRWIREGCRDLGNQATGCTP